MDKRIYLFFAFVFILAAGTFSFRYSNYEPCVDVNFAFDQLQPKAGTVIQFNDNTKGANKWEWDFGDKTETKHEKREFHVFEEPGFYEVTLKVNNNCEMTKPIYVEANTKVLDPTKFPRFTVPKSIRVGERLVVTDESKIAETWEWRFGESAKVDATTKTARHVYRRPGTYSVSLIINDEIDYLVKKIIQVRPPREINAIPSETVRNTLNLPDAPEPEIIRPSNSGNQPVLDQPKEVKEKVAPPPIVVEKEKKPEKPKEEPKDVRPTLTEDIIIGDLRKIAKSKLSPQNFTKYFCDDKNPFVLANGKSYTFDKFSKLIRGKNVIINKITWGSENKCLYSFEINFTR